MNSGEVGIRRRRECKKCRKRFTTYEKVVKLDLKVIKKDNRLEDFEREKIRKGVRKACWKRNVTQEQIEDLIEDIEMKLMKRKTTRIPSTDIGRMILNRLKKLDDVAYLRFASVYLEFNCATDFKNFINQWKDSSVTELSIINNV